MFLIPSSCSFFSSPPPPGLFPLLPPYLSFPSCPLLSPSLPIIPLLPPFFLILPSPETCPLKIPNVCPGLAESEGCSLTHSHLTSLEWRMLTHSLTLTSPHWSGGCSLTHSHPTSLEWRVLCVLLGGVVGLLVLWRRHRPPGTMLSRILPLPPGWFKPLHLLHPKGLFHLPWPPLG